MIDLLIATIKYLKLKMYNTYNKPAHLFKSEAVEYISPHPIKILIF